MFLLIAPISGNYFPIQIWEVLTFMKIYHNMYKDLPFNKHVMQYDKNPTLCLGTSGGVIALYIASNANFKEENLDLSILNSDKLISYTFGGSLWKVNINKLNNIKPFNVSMIIGTYDKKSHKPIYITNDRSYQKEEKDILYWEDGEIPKAMVASMSIPYIFSSVKTDNLDLVDGGVGSPSPFSIINNEDLYKHNTLKIVYLSSEDNNDTYQFGYKDIINSLYKAEIESVKLAFKLFCMINKLNYTHEITTDIDNIITSPNFLIIIVCRLNKYEMSMTNFDENIIRNTKKYIEGYDYECFYTSLTRKITYI